MFSHSGLFEQRLKGTMRTKELGAGDVLFMSGDASRGLFILQSGRVRLVRRCLEGREATMHSPRVGESFAEASIYSETYHCDCIADIPSRVTLVPRQILLRELEREPAFAAMFARHLADQVHALRAALELRNIRSAEHRVISALNLRLKPGQNHVTIEPSLKAFAGEIGLTHEALYRTLRKLEDAGALRRKGRQIRFSGEKAE